MAPEHAPTGLAASGSDDGQDLRLVLRAATMYHLEGATHAEIARRLGVSRPTAGRLVARARALGLVRIVFDVPEHLARTVHTELEADLEELYDLDEVVVIEEDLDHYRPAALATLGRAAAAVLARRLRPSDTLGFTWGPETSATSAALTSRTGGCRRVVQLDGALGGHDFQTGAAHTFAQLTRRLDAEAVNLIAPLFADVETVRALTRDSRLSQALQIGADADAMVFGCGTLGPLATLMRGAFIDPRDVDQLRDAGAVGEIGGKFYDEQGRPVHPGLSERTVSVPLDAIRACPTTVLVSGGEPHREAIRGALVGGLATVLVTDVTTARWLGAPSGGGRSGPTTHEHDDPSRPEHHHLA